MVYSGGRAGHTYNHARRLIKDALVELVPVAAELDVPLSKLALAWCVKNPNVSTVITGASSAQQVRENMTALDALELLTDDVMARIDAVTAA